MNSTCKKSASITLFSIISVTLNNLEGLQRTGKSLSDQIYQNFEWIVIDGASIDGTLDYIDRHSKARLFSGEDGGIYDAMNRSLKHINGSYCLFLNAGDSLLDPTTLDKIAHAIAITPEYVLIYGDSMELTMKGKVYKPARSHTKILWGFFTHHQSVLYSASRLKEFHYNTDYRIAADYDLTLRFLNSLQEKQIKRLPFAIALYESGGISQTKPNQGRLEQLAIRHSLNICNPALNMFVFLVQWAVWQFRKLLPDLYWSIKSKR